MRPHWERTAWGSWRLRSGRRVLARVGPRVSGMHSWITDNTGQSRWCHTVQRAKRAAEAALRREP